MTVPQRSQLKSRALLVAGIVLAVWLVVRNIPVEPFTSLRV